MPNKKKHWTQTKAGRQKLKEIAASRKTIKESTPALEKAAQQFQASVNEAERCGYQSAMSTLDNRARDAQIELAKALGNVAHAIAVFVGEWRR